MCVSACPGASVDVLEGPLFAFDLRPGRADAAEDFSRSRWVPTIEPRTVSPSSTVPKIGTRSARSPATPAGGFFGGPRRPTSPATEAGGTLRRMGNMLFKIGNGLWQAPPGERELPTDQQPEDQTEHPQHGAWHPHARLVRA